MAPSNKPRRRRGRAEVYLYAFFNLGARWGCVVNARPRPLYPLRKKPVPILQQAAWAPRLTLINAEKWKTSYCCRKSSSKPPSLYSGPISTTKKIMVTEIFLISDSDITLTESSWKTWPNFLPPSFVKIVTEDMMLYDDSYSRARSIHFTQQQKKWHRRFVLYQQRSFHAWHFGCTEHSYCQPRYNSTLIMGMVPWHTTTHGHKSTHCRVYSFTLLSWIDFIFVRHKLDFHFPVSVNLAMFWFLIHFILKKRRVSSCVCLHTCLTVELNAKFAKHFYGHQTRGSYH